MDWPAYGGNKAGNRYSPLQQIDAGNVQKLQVAWTYDSNDPSDTGGHKPYQEIQCQPIVVHGVLYGTTAKLKLFALDAATGKELWKFDPFAGMMPFYHQNRGVVYWEQGADKRILYTAGPNLYAVNADNGKIVEGFGVHGKVDLHEGLSVNYDASRLFVDATSPGVVYGNTLILGSTVSESGDAAPGYVRGYDVLTGKINWIFHTIPQPGEFGYDTWSKDAYKKIGGTNNWSGLVVDEKRGMVFFGTGSPAADFYGGEREGINLFSDCIVALDARTGQLKWYYQTIHHDLWDRDIPCPPNLATVRHNGKLVDVVVQATKDGCVYVLDRDSGTSLFPVEERSVPVNGLPGEHPWVTQKFPVKPLPFSTQAVTDSDITDLSPAAHAYVQQLFKQMDHGDKFLPPGTKGTLLVGYSGGAEWGGNAIDSNGILYQNANNAIWVLKMQSMEDLRKEMAVLSEGKGLYMANCASCHGQDRKGNGKEIPSLWHIDSRLKTEQIAHILKVGQGRMPSFQVLPEEQRKAIIDFLQSRRGVSGEHAASALAGKKVGGQVGTRGLPAEKAPDFPYQPDYVPKQWDKLTDADGYPGSKPPWGTLNAIDLNTGDYRWRVPLGEYPELAKKGVRVTGTESYGGPLVTAGGLVFIAGTRDAKFRAFDKNTGKQVWEYQLPAGGFATPITYEKDGKQYIAIAAGGGRGLPPGGYYIAFALGQGRSAGGWILMLVFIGLAIVFRRSATLKGFSFTMMILAAVSLAMYYPSYFVQIGGFRLSRLILPLLQVIMFGMGTALSIKDLRDVLKMPGRIGIGVLCHYTIMPVVGFAVAHIFRFPGEIAAGIILVGCCPSGLASNVMSYLAKANLALSVSVTTVSTLLAPLATPLLMRLLAGQFVAVHFWSMVVDMMQIVILPILAGILFHYIVKGRAAWLNKVMPLVSMTGIGLIIVVITAAGRDSLLSVGLLLILASLIQNIAGYVMGYWAARAFRLGERDCRTISLEVGMQNAGLASGLALTMGKLATVGLAPAIFGPMMNTTGSSLATWWHGRPPGEKIDTD